MVSICKENNGCALSAPQVGIGNRFFVTVGGLTYINPELILQSLEKTMSYEGCLSIPGLVLPVSRSHCITVTSSLYGREVLTGLQARIFLHELDHLDGILFPRRFAEYFEWSK